jgi:hypothetical protein
MITVDDRPIVANGDRRLAFEREHLLGQKDHTGNAS